MALCSNRPEGFGPVSHLYSHFPTSCFLDTVLVPLCSWIYFLALLLSLLLSSRGRDTPHDHAPRRRNCFRSSKGPDYSSPYSAEQKYSLSKARRAGEAIYGLLLFAVLALCVIEIVRLALAQLGVGLLPFTLAALVMAALIHYTYGLGGVIGSSPWLNGGLFFGLAVVNSVKLAGELKEGFGTRKGTKYPMSDQVTDVGVMVGLYVILGILEAVLH